jgi:hypothetical protein
MEKSPRVGVVGFTNVAILDAILLTNVSKRANCASMALGWFGINLVAGPLLATPFAFWPLPELWDFPTFLT